MSPPRGLVYYLPGGPTASRKRVEEAGLGYLFDGPRGPNPTHVATDKGPDGKSGAFFTVAGIRGLGAPSSPTLGEKATWGPIPGTPAWLGVHAGVLPGPADLARHELVAGHEVELGDGARWLVPVVRSLHGGTNLPAALQWDGIEWRRGDVRPAYRALFAAGLRLWEAISGASDGVVTLTEEATTAATALAVNYRLGPAEVSALGLFDTRTEAEVLKALVDLPALAALGNAEAVGPSGRPGGAV